ncbi:MAG: hypothetical protein FWE09_00615 [Treponema sp.]|nr:hypothetical protein [Treponema sp.]
MIDIDYLLFTLDPNFGRIGGTETQSSAYSFEVKAEMVSASVAQLVINHKGFGHIVDDSRDVQFIIRFNQRVEINGQSAGYAWEPAYGRYWHGSLRPVNSGGYLFVLNFSLHL